MEQFLNDKNYFIDTIRAKVIREMLDIFQKHLAGHLNVEANKLMENMKVIADGILDVDVSARKAPTTIFDELNAINAKIQGIQTAISRLQATPRNYKGDISQKEKIQTQINNLRLQLSKQKVERNRLMEEAVALSQEGISHVETLTKKYPPQAPQPQASPIQAKTPKEEEPVAKTLKEEEVKVDDEYVPKSVRRRTREFEAERSLRIIENLRSERIKIQKKMFEGEIKTLEEHEEAMKHDEALKAAIKSEEKKFESIESILKNMETEGNFEAKKADSTLFNPYLVHFNDHLSYMPNY